MKWTIKNIEFHYLETGRTDTAFVFGLRILKRFELKDNRLSSQIVLLNALYLSYERHIVHCSSSHPFWCIHDALHGLYDIRHGEIYAPRSIEKLRLEQARDFCKKEGIEMDAEFLEEVRRQSRERWKEELI